MTQLTLFTHPSAPESAQETPARVYYCDVLVCSFFDEKKKRLRIRPLPGQDVCEKLLVRCSHKARNAFPVGTVFKIDVLLQYGKRAAKEGKGIVGSPFLTARAGCRMIRAIEYFDHNLRLQKAQPVACA